MTGLHYRCRTPGGLTFEAKKYVHHVLKSFFVISIQTKKQDTTNPTNPPTSNPSLIKLNKCSSTTKTSRLSFDSCFKTRDSVILTYLNTCDVYHILHVFHRTSTKIPPTSPHAPRKDLWVVVVTTSEWKWQSKMIRLPFGGRFKGLLVAGVLWLLGFREGLKVACTICFHIIIFGWIIHFKDQVVSILSSGLSGNKYFESLYSTYT